MSDCIDVEYNKVVKYAAKAAKTMEEKAGKGKDLKFNYFQLTTDAHGESGPNMLKSLFSKSASTVSKAAADLGKIIGRTDLKDGMSSILNDLNADRALLALLDKDGTKTPAELVEHSIGLNHILEALNNEPAIVAKYGLNKTTADTTKILNEKTGKMEQTTGLERLFPTIGQAVLEAQGIFMVGSRYYNIAAFEQKGREVVQALKADGLVKVQEQGTWIIKGIKPTNGTYVKELTDTGMTVMLDSDVITNEDAMGNILRQLMRVITAQKALAPKTEASETNMELQKISKMDKDTIETMSNVQKSKFRISTESKAFFDELHAMYKNNSTKGFKSKIKAKFGMSEKEFSSKVLGLEIEAQTSMFHDSLKGKEISKVNPLIALMENYETLSSEEFFYTFFMAGNSREFINESVLNYQSDKHMARQILVASEPVKYTTADEVTNLVNRMAVMFGVHTDVIRGTRQGTEAMEAYLGMLAKGNTTDVLIDIARNPDDSGINADNVFGQLKALSAIAEVRKGSESIVESTFIAESDATASGIILKMMQSTHSPEVQATLTKMGIGQETEEGYEDAYALTTQKFNEIVSELDALPAAERKRTAKAKTVDQALRLIELLDMKKFRDLIKMPIMTFSYHQEEKNNQADFGKDATRRLLTGSMDNLNAAIEEFNITTTKNGDVAPFRKFTDSKRPTIEEQEEIYLALPPLIADTTGKFLVEDILIPVYREGMFQKTEDLVDGLFKLISEAPAVINEDGKSIDGSAKNGNVAHVKFMSPLAVLNWMDNHPGEEFTLETYKKLKEYRIVADKRFETRLKVGDGQHGVVVKENHANKTSLHVLPIHAMDAAILIRAVKKTYEGLKSTLGDDFKDSDLESIMATPVMLVHDAVSIPPKYSAMVEAAYEQEIMRVSHKYDTIQMLKYEYELKTGIPLHDATMEGISAHAEMLASKNKFFEDLYDSETDTYTVLNNSFSEDLSPEAIQEVNDAYDAKHGVKPEPTPDPTPTKPTQSGSNTELEINEAVEKVVAEGDLEGNTVDTNPFQSIQDKLPKLVTDFFSLPGVSKYLNKAEKYSFNPITDAIGIKPDPDPDTFTVEALHHEVVHFYTTAYLLNDVSEDSNSVGYVREAVQQLQALAKDGKLSPIAKERIDYVTKSGNERVQIAEFVAIMESEPDVAQEIYSSLEANKKNGLVTKIVEAIKAIMKAAKAMVITDDHIDTMIENGADPEVLFGAIQNIITDGKKFREDVSALNEAKTKMASDEQGELYSPAWANKFEKLTLKGIYKDLNKDYMNEYNAIMDVINRFKECR